MNNDAVDPAAALDAWRAQGDDRADPVRFRVIEALVRRAAAHEGEARRILDDKLRARLAAYGDALVAARAASASAHPSASATQAPRGPLGELVDRLAQQAQLPADGAPAGDAGARPAATPELKSMRYFKHTWSKLSADRRLVQSLAKLPDNAGPLNSHQLVHRALTLMRDLSPEYLNRFMSHVDALLWLDQANVGGLPTGAAAPRGEGARKSARSKAA